MDIFNELQQRDMLYHATEGLEEAFSKEKITAYIGFDPSAASLHVGSLLPVMGLVRLQQHGHAPIAIVGGGTGMIGDPSGKTEERRLLSREEIEFNLHGIKNQLSRFLDFETKVNPARIVNNAEWLAPISMLDFLRDVGKYFSVNSMLAKESVKRRLEQQDGISFTEFSYSLLQAYDFLALFDRYGCQLQMGGSDQLGNIVAGIELIRRVRAKKAYGLVFPLVTTSAGIKFGKTEAGAVWLDPNLTSAFRFYQFWLNTDDRDVIRYLKFFTQLELEEIRHLDDILHSQPELREPQRKLAQAVTCAVHGDVAMAQAEQASRVLFGGDPSNLAAADLLEIFRDVPSSQVNKMIFEGSGISLIELVVLSGYANSKSEARRLIDGGGIYINNRRFSDSTRMIDISQVIDGKVLILRRGSKNYHLFQIA